MTQDDARAYAGMMAATQGVVTKQLPLRDLLGGPRSGPMRVSTVTDLPRLFSGAEETQAQRVSRLSAASLLYSVNKQDAKRAKQVLRGAERRCLDTLHEHRRERAKTDRSCAHCRLLYGMLYEAAGAKPFPPMAVVNHRAKINVEFDPDTNVSSASIDRFQLLAPRVVVEDLIRFSHPLHWSDPEDSLFQRSDPVDEDGKPHAAAHGSQSVEESWEAAAATAAGAHVFEDVIWPLNAEQSARVENIINISRFVRDEADEALTLSFDYSLQCSLRSSFGIGFERAGLDLDGGKVKLRAIPVDPLRPSFQAASDRRPVDSKFEMGGIPLGHLRCRDLVEMRAVTEPRLQESLFAGTIGSDDVTANEILTTLSTLGGELTRAWSQFAPYYLLDVEASKRLHFTVPENGPIELWQALTWTAPALLFLFLNRAIALAPHLLMLKRLETSSEASNRWPPTKQPTTV